MKYTFKKLLCVLLAAFMLFSIPLSVSAAETDPVEAEEEVPPNGSPLPVVFVGGQEDFIYSDKNDPDSGILLTRSLPEGAIKEIMDACEEQLRNGLLRNDWDPFCEALTEAITPYFSALSLNEYGYAENTTGYDCLKADRLTDEAVDGIYGLYDYKFIYDWRLDPCANAIELDAFVNAVKNAAGTDKVDIVASGLGYSTVLAYFAQFGGKDVAKCVLYGAGLKGIDTAGVLFSGKMHIDDDALNRYIQENLSDSDLLLAIAQYGADLVITNGFADTLFSITARIYRQIYEKVLPGLLLNTFATMPGYWSVIGDEYYEDAKALIFGTEEEDTADHAVFIDKTDRFHYSVLNKATEILDSAAADGTYLFNVVKYGLQMMPLSVNADITSDGLVDIASATLGAVSANIGQKLSEEYIAGAIEDHSPAFLSPDKEIDAYPGYLKLHTWYIKNLSHFNDPEVVDQFIFRLLSDEKYTSVINQQEYHQFLVCSNDAQRMENLTETGVITPTIKDEVEDFFSFDSPTGFIRKIFDLVAKLTMLMREFISIFTSEELTKL